MSEDVLSLEHIRKALEIREPIDIDRRVVVHPGVWDDYKRTFNLTEAQMDKYFIKAEYIPLDDIQ